MNKLETIPIVVQLNETNFGHEKFSHKLWTKTWHEEITREE